MQATQAREHRDHQRSASQEEQKCRNHQTTLVTRYRRIGISAVAAAVRHKDESKAHKAANSNHALRYERE